MNPNLPNNFTVFETNLTLLSLSFLVVCNHLKPYVSLVHGSDTVTPKYACAGVREIIRYVAVCSRDVKRLVKVAPNLVNVRISYLI
jgi:hypothetical protein